MEDEYLFEESDSDNSSDSDSNDEKLIKGSDKTIIDSNIEQIETNDNDESDIDSDNENDRETETETETEETETETDTGAVVSEIIENEYNEVKNMQKTIEQFIRLQ